MSRSKIVKKQLKDGDMTAMFNQLIGGDGDPDIVKEKEVKLNKNIKTLHQILHKLANGPLFKSFPEYKRWSSEMKKFNQDIQSLMDEKLEYQDLKEHNQVKRIIMMCKELMPYKHYLKTCSTAKDSWIMSHPGISFQPFAFTGFDVKIIWCNDEVTPIVKTYVLRMVCLLFLTSRKTYDLVTSPDIDVKKFANVIIGSIEKIKKMPELSRCDDAFEKLASSVDLFENNFNGYYKDMVQSANPNTILESFIIDVSTGNEMNPNLTRQFRKILNFYRKQQSKSGKKRDPRLKKLFSTLNSKMNMLEESMGITPEDDENNDKKDDKKEDIA